MAHRPHPSFLLGVASLAAVACSGSNSTNAAPRLAEVPQQSVLGGQTFTLDLADYVTDREGATLTYAVSSGGGTFAGSSYSNAFDTMGLYTVEYTVSDGDKTTPGTFVVAVTSANLVVVGEDGSGLLLLDSATNAFVRVAGSAAAPGFDTGLADGRTVYHLGGASPQVWVFDPMTRGNTRLGAAAGGSASYAAKTSDGKVLVLAGASNQKHLYLYNPISGLQRDIAQDLLDDATVLVNSGDLVCYEMNVNGQTDIYAYDVAEDETFAVATESTAEQLQATLPNGGVVFSRIGGGGESDLFCYRVATGLVEIGSDVSGIATADKVYVGQGSASQVVFTASTGGTSDVYSWNPLNGQTTLVSGTSGNVDAVVGIGAGNEVVFERTVSGSETDAYFYDLDSGDTAAVRNASDQSDVLAVSSDGTTAWAFVRPSGTTSSLLAVSLVASPATVTWAAGGAVGTTLHTLANGDVVALRSDGTALNLFDVSAGAWLGAPITGTDLAFGGDGVDAGDFAYTAEVSSQTDLLMWDASATNSVVISDAGTDDTFQARTQNGTILYSRPVGSHSNDDLFVWDGSDNTQLTDEDAASLRHDYGVLGKYAGSR
ncbi:MAG: hypothetical protein IT455_13895 [Planctomycetes bacterium]|nr:hypothetical protein [Planctomycetota bacterium]